MSNEDGSEGASADPSSGTLDELRRRIDALEKASDTSDDDEKVQRKVDAAVEARIARLVLQAGPGISVSGGNGNFTISIDASALSMSGTGICNDDGSSTFTFTLKV